MSLWEGHGACFDTQHYAVLLTPRKEGSGILGLLWMREGARGGSSRIASSPHRHQRNLTGAPLAPKCAKGRPRGSRGLSQSPQGDPGESLEFAGDNSAYYHFEL